MVDLICQQSRGVEHGFTPRHVKRTPPNAVVGQAGCTVSLRPKTTALQALDAVAPGGHAVLVGIPAFAVRAPISPFNMVFAEKNRHDLAVPHSRERVGAAAPAGLLFLGR
jgi:threonine dehydrogenase-like Zn-dependent dehydrogenase